MIYWKVKLTPVVSFLTELTDKSHVKLLLNGNKFGIIIRLFYTSVMFLSPLSDTMICLIIEYSSLFQKS